MTADVRARPKRRTALWIGLAGIALLAAAGGVGAYLLGGEAADAVAPPVAVAGELVLTGSGIAFAGTRSYCTGSAGYDDIHEGTQIVISDAAGTTIGVGALGAGKTDAWAGTLNEYPQYCAFAFTMPSVPGGHAFYGITVGKRGTVQYPAAAIAKPLKLSLS